MVNADQILTESLVKELGELKFYTLRLEATLTVANQRIRELEAPVQKSDK